ncbi:lactonase family protein [Alkalihalobacillus pseudalcaliphilus]|uniref:lactonase family protein n=1 Tax=Alkalihalobacillus pseudalcaliphilus TaxID=79884 RepID=UPI00064DA341|nr:beta-propeller fold lactonase family protein [Alkalihalobacillus pseudalcaliphilus]KMK77034.1 hypothetical protein AB990_05625 [Alkalihalobacillus pseudalcaliphilus]
MGVKRYNGKLMFIGTYHTKQEDAILVYEQQSDYSWQQVGRTNGISNPSYVTLNQNGDRLYAVSEVKEGAVVCYEVVRKDHSILLNELNRIDIQQHSPCFITLSEEEDAIFVTNYGAGTVTVLLLDEDGRYNQVRQQLDFTNFGQQSHPHQIKRLTQNYYLITDLALNRLFIYQWDTKSKKFHFCFEQEAKAGAGPRHCEFDENSNSVYVINEHVWTVSAYDFNITEQKLTHKQEIATIPKEFHLKNYGADIHLDQHNRVLYTSNRGHHSITAYKLNEKGDLHMLDYTMLAGEWPRNFHLDAKNQFLYVANEHTNSVHQFKITGLADLKEVSVINHIHKPVCLQIR